MQIYDDKLHTASEYIYNVSGRLHAVHYTELLVLF